MIRDRLKHLVGRISGRFILEEKINASTNSVHTELEKNFKAVYNLSEGIEGICTDVESLNKNSVLTDLNVLFSRKQDEKAIFLLLGHDYSNLGDLAIDFSEYAYIANYFPDYKIYQFTRQNLLQNWGVIKSRIFPEDVIVLHGGGNFGDIWPVEEKARQALVRQLPLNKIISFPQSIKYTDNTALKEASEVYGNHKNLLIAVRDETSYEIAIKHFKRNTVVRTQDIVLSYQYLAAENESTNSIIVYRRRDREKKEHKMTELVELIRTKHYVYESDTVVDRRLIPNRGHAAQAVYKKIDEAHSARLIVTDRLHGAVFALLAGRPVIVFDNSYGKIKGALKNISEKISERIIFAEDDGVNIDINTIDMLYDMKDSKLLPHEVLKSEFDDFAEKIRNFIND